MSLWIFKPPPPHSLSFPHPLLFARDCIPTQIFFAKLLWLFFMKLLQPLFMDHFLVFLECVQCMFFVKEQFGASLQLF
jgi:hypothetical protein